MAAHERLISETSIASSTSTLNQRLAAALPNDITFEICHLSTPPTRASALYSAPPKTRPDRTYCESHFLAVSIRTGPAEDAKDVLIFAIEILMYSTAYSTTFFVSKADSTGYLHLLKLPKGTPSPLRDISTTFLRHLVEQRQRPNIRSVISLFARAQDQYLFPGSIENEGKHVLDDRGLIKWWCRVLNPLLDDSDTSLTLSEWKEVKGYLTIPGLDSHETLSYIPSKIRPPGTNSPWTIGHPLRELSRHSTTVPPRCLVPRFPDDPKARFLDELDDELSKGRSEETGQWKSVKSIDQFWEMMAFRQECSAGRLVGFIWIIFSPLHRSQATHSVIEDSQTSITSVDCELWDHRDPSSTPQRPVYEDGLLTPNTSFNASSQVQPTSPPSKPSQADFPSPSQKSTSGSKQSRPKKKKLSGIIVPRQPRVKTKNRNYLLEIPETTAYYKWSPEGRGQVIVEESDYKRITELLLRLDFATLDLAISSSRRWVNEVRSGVSGSVSESWGQTVTGTKQVELRQDPSATGVNTLMTGLVRKKRKADPEPSGSPPFERRDTPAPVNVLGAGMIRKKAKV